MPRSTPIVATMVALAMFAAAACGTSEPPAELAGVTVGDGFDVAVVTTGFDGPTQLAAVGDGRHVIGVLAGAENDGSGQVLIFDLDEPDDRVVLATDLDKPTGVAVRDGRLFVIETTRLTERAIEPGSPATAVVDDLANNGRSQGSLTVTERGDLFFDTSGAKRGPERVAGSGTLFVLPDGADRPVEFATGFKHAYAHVEVDDERLFVVEMTDGTFDGERGQDELIIVEPGDDAGWPFCVDDNRPVDEFGGTPERCAMSPRSHALFGAGATPTAVIVAPWDPAMLLVALWIPGTIVQVPVEPVGPAETPHRGEVIVEGIESPQSLLVDGERVLIVDHDTGTIFALTAD